jgi:hypothetical protein
VDPMLSTPSSSAPLAPLPGSAGPEAVLDRFLAVAGERGLQLYAEQEEAVLELFAGHNVILNTPTGSGKSLVATAFHFRALCAGERSVYTCPIKALVKYRSGRSGCLTWARDPGQGHCLMGSLTGAVASQKVTEAPKGTLSPVGNRVPSASAQGCLTVRQTCRAGAKAGTSDPASACGSGVAQRLKGTPGITG